MRKRKRIPEASNSNVIYSSASVAGRPVRGATTGTEAELVHQARQLLASFVQTMDDLLIEFSGGLALHNMSKKWESPELMSRIRTKPGLFRLAPSRIVVRQ